MAKLFGIEQGGDYYETVVMAIELMFDALKTYGKQPSANLADAWVMTLADRGVTPQEVAAGTRHFLRGKDFPQPGEFCEWVEARRENQELRERLAEAVKALDERNRRENEEIVARNYGGVIPDPRERRMIRETQESRHGDGLRALPLTDLLVDPESDHARRVLEQARHAKEVGQDE